MATNSESAVLAALMTTKVKLRDSILSKGVTYTIPGTIEKIAGNTNGDYILLCPLHRDWSVASIKTAGDALSGLTSINVGLVAYAPVGDGVTDVDENCYANAVDISSAHAFTERAFTTRDIAKNGQYVWQDAGIASRELAAEWYILALHIGAASTATGTISWQVTVVAPG